MMKKKVSPKAAVARAAVFSLFILILYCLLTKLVVPKFLFENSSWPSTSTFTQFYDMEKNTVDVVFLGSSSIASMGDPQYLYNTKGIVSYNLASPEQTLITSYYWLKESLRFQSPSVVFLDNQMLFTFYADEALNYKEPGQRKDFDYMRWSFVKMAAVNDFCSLDPSQSRLSYYIPLVRYHERWKELGALDFSYTPSRLYGFAPLCDNLHEPNEPDFVPLSDQSSADSSEQFLPLMKEYMDRIVSLCREEDITLILITTVSPVQTQNRHNLTKQYAEANGLIYLDFNTEALYTAAGIEYFSDCSDSHHMAVSGSKKLCGYLGEYLLSRQLVSPKESSDFESTKQYYEEFTENM